MSPKIRKVARTDGNIFGVVQLRRSPGENEEYDLTFLPNPRDRGTTPIVSGVNGTRQRMISIISELGIEDSKMTVFEAGNLGSTARHVSFRQADIDYLLRLVKFQGSRMPVRESTPLPRVQRRTKI